MSFFCTLFDSNYLTRGLAMYESLKRHSRDFHLFILAFDEICEQILQKLHLENVTIISLRDFEDDELKKVKTTRSRREYCWTCTPSLVKYCIEKYRLDMCTYLDADIYFYDDPRILIEEMGDASIMISPHRYTPFYDQSLTSGIYCVQFVTFKNDARGLMALEWWRRSCNEWCYARVEDGKFGDQKYLDDWPKRFQGVHVMENLGGGVAPWNVQQYEFWREEAGKIFLRDKKTRKVFPLVFYHYHNLRFIEKERIDLGTYILPNWTIKILYKPYISHLLKIGDMLQEIKKGDYHGIVVSRKNWKHRILSFWGKVNFLNGLFFLVFNSLLPINRMNRISVLARLARLLTKKNNIYSLKKFKEK